MSFRKDSLLFYESEIIFIVTIIVDLVVIPALGLGYFLLFALPVIVLIFVNPKRFLEYIIINENGISCEKNGIQLWSYAWDSIAELRKSRRYAMPSIEIITYQHLAEPVQFTLANHYFQLCKAAKEAIKKYYKPLECSQDE